MYGGGWGEEAEEDPEFVFGEGHEEGHEPEGDEAGQEIEHGNLVAFAGVLADGADAEREDGEEQVAEDEVDDAEQEEVVGDLNVVEGAPETGCGEVEQERGGREPYEHLEQSSEAEGEDFSDEQLADGDGGEEDFDKAAFLFIAETSDEGGRAEHIGEDEEDGKDAGDDDVADVALFGGEIAEFIESGDFQIHGGGDRDNGLGGDFSGELIDGEEAFEYGGFDGRRHHFFVDGVAEDFSGGRVVFGDDEVVFDGAVDEGLGGGFFGIVAGEPIVVGAGRGGDEVGLIDVAGRIDGSIGVFGIAGDEIDDDNAEEQEYRQGECEGEKADALYGFEKFVFEDEGCFIHDFLPARSRKISWSDGVVISKWLMAAPLSRTWSRMCWGSVSGARKSST